MLVLVSGTIRIGPWERENYPRANTFARKMMRGSPCGPTQVPMVLPVAKAAAKEPCSPMERPKLFFRALSNSQIRSTQLTSLCTCASLSQYFINIVTPCLFLPECFSNLHQRSCQFRKEGYQRSVDVDSGDDVLAEKCLAGEIEGEFDLLVARFSSISFDTYLLWSKYVGIP